MKKAPAKKDGTKAPAKPTGNTAVQRLTPGEDLEKQKFDKFLKALRVTGNITKSAEAAGMGKPRLYDRLNTDTEFANRWVEALEAHSDELWAEVVRRGKDGVNEPIFHNGKKIADVKKYSDTLLIFAVKQHEYKKKWRDRVIKTGNIALSVIATRGPQIGLTAAQIEDIQLTMTQEFANVPTN